MSWLSGNYQFCACSNNAPAEKRRSELQDVKLESHRYEPPKSIFTDETKARVWLEARVFIII